MEQEIQVLEENNTSTLEPLREGKKWVDCRPVYKIIHKANGEIERSIKLNWSQKILCKLKEKIFETFA